MSEACKKLFPHEDIVSLIKFYGDPRGSNGQVSRKWYAENIVKWTPPYKIYYSDGKRTPLKTLLLHKKVVPVYTAAYTEVAKEFSPQEIDALRLNISGGTFNYRVVRGGNRLSTHAFGIAIDMDPARNPYPKKWKEGMINREFCDILMKHGLWWRGLNGDVDAMHFQAAWRN
jgi:hypothetical protein